MNDNTKKILKERYFKEGENSWEDLCKRVCTAIAMAEETPGLQKQYKKEFFGIMRNMDFIPSTPCLMNAGSVVQQLSSCFIIAIKDNIESIYGGAKPEIAKIFQKNGGAGMNVSVLRPTDTPVLTSGGRSCGLLGFMEEFDLTADVITRNNVRKGALKIDLNDWHPDICRFIKCKNDTSKLTHMNISVSLSDKFMNAVKNSEMWDLVFPDYENVDKVVYDKEWDGDIDSWKEKGFPVKVYQQINASELYDEIMAQAWATGEPGVSFRDTMDRQNPNPHMGRVDATNPCSEFASVPYNSCNLGSINLSNMLRVVDGTADKYVVDYGRLDATVRSAVRFLDNMITVNQLPLASIDTVTKALRSIGLGTMGLADMLYRLKIAYGSRECIKFVKDLYERISVIAETTSIKLADEKGVYEKWVGSTWHRRGVRIRNSNHISIAPNGSISFIANTSGGIEPNFALAYTRRTNDGTEYNVVNPIFWDVLKFNGLYADKIVDKIVNNNGSCKGIEEIPQSIQDVFVVAGDISPDKHVAVVAEVQKNTDLAVSKTVNLPHSASIEDVKDVYMSAWELGIKGITIYRDGSRENQTLSVKKQQKNSEKTSISDAGSVLGRGDILSVSDDLLSYKRTVVSGCGKFYIHADFDEVTGEMLETFIEPGSGGGCERNLQFISRLISIALRGGVPVESIIDQALSIKPCKGYTDRAKQTHDTSKGTSCPSAIGYSLIELDRKIRERCFFDDTPVDEDAHAEAQKLSANPQTDIQTVNSKGICPECSSGLHLETGCVICKACGWSRCN